MASTRVMHSTNYFTTPRRVREERMSVDFWVLAAAKWPSSRRPYSRHSMHHRASIKQAVNSAPAGSKAEEGGGEPATMALGILKLQFSFSSSSDAALWHDSEDGNKLDHLGSIHRDDERLSVRQKPEISREPPRLNSSRRPPVGRNVLDGACAL